MTEDRESSHDADQAEQRATEALHRATQAQGRARELAGRLADTGEDLAETLDRLASTREHAGRLGEIDTESKRRLARRARDRAEGERQDSRALRDKWDLPPTGG